MRVKTGVVRTRRHKRLLKQARGFYSGRRKHFRKAKEDKRKEISEDCGLRVSMRLQDLTV